MVSLSDVASVRLMVSREHTVYIEDTEKLRTGVFFNIHIQHSWKKAALALHYLDETEAIGLVSGKLYYIMTVNQVYLIENQEISLLI